MAQKFFDIAKLNDVYYGEITGEQSIIAKGKIGSHDFAIINRTLNPCSYIRLNPNSPFLGKDEEDIPIDCHYGLTYARNHSMLGFDELPIGYWIGWDYGHLGDYCNGDIRPVDGFSHKWTYEELIQEMIYVCGQLDAAEYAEQASEGIVSDLQEQLGKLHELNAQMEEFLDKRVKEVEE